MEKKAVTYPIKFIVIGGSSGSLKVLLRLLPELRPGFSIPILLVLHRNSQHESVLTELLASRTTFPVKEVEEKETIQPGNIYVAPQDYHVLIEENFCFSLDYSEKLHYSRPSIDVSFMSAAVAYKQQLLGILLSGANSDGAEGIRTIKQYMGTTIVQDPEEAEVAYMPLQAIATATADHILDTVQIVAFLHQL